MSKTGGVDCGSHPQALASSCPGGCSTLAQPQAPPPLHPFRKSLPHPRPCSTSSPNATPRPSSSQPASFCPNPCSSLSLPAPLACHGAVLWCAGGPGREGEELIGRAAGGQEALRGEKGRLAYQLQ